MILRILTAPFRAITRWDDLRRARHFEELAAAAWPVLPEHAEALWARAIQLRTKWEPRS